MKIRFVPTVKMNPNKSLSRQVRKHSPLGKL